MSCSDQAVNMFIFSAKKKLFEWVFMWFLLLLEPASGGHLWYCSYLELLHLLHFLRVVIVIWHFNITGLGFLAFFLFQASFSSSEVDSWLYISIFCLKFKNKMCWNLSLVDLFVFREICCSMNESVD